MGALLYLTLCSAKNRMRVRLRRLREPRYLAGLVVGILYFYFLLYRPGRPGRQGALAALAAVRDPIELAGSVALFALIALAWAWPSSGQPALMFSRADVQFLFAAPFTRRQLIAYKVLRTQIGAIVSSALVTVFFRPSSVEGGWMFFAGIMVVTATLIVHFTGVSLSRASLRQHGASGLSRQWLPLGVVLAAVAVLAGTVAADWTRLGMADRPADVARELQRLGSTGPARVVLWPFTTLVRLPLAASPGEFLRTLPFALALLALNFLWVLRSDAAFEEASAALAEKIARVRRGDDLGKKRVRGLPTPFTLALSGRVETALLWKNLILLGRYSTRKLVVTLLPIIIIVGVLAANGAGRRGIAEGLAILCLLLAAMTIVVGPMMIRNDLRQDLANLEVLKAWPVSGAVLVRGESLAPAAVLSALSWLFIIGATALSSRLLLGLGIGTVAGRLSYVVAALIVAPGLIVTQVVVQNGIAVMFPAWISVGATRARGLDVMGQRMLMLAGTMVALVLAVVPAAVFGGLAALAVYFATSLIPVILPAAIVTAVLLVECLLATEALGRIMDRTDIGAVDAPE